MPEMSSNPSEVTIALFNVRVIIAKLSNITADRVTCQNKGGVLLLAPIYP